MEIKVLPKDVADAFVKQYYVILNKCPENAYKFYQEASLLGWPGPDGVVTPATTLSEINDKIMSSDHKSCSMDIKTVDAQESLEGGIIIAVTGSFVCNDNVMKNFLQTFFLAKQERGFFVLNDILRFFDACLPITNSAANDGAVNDQSVIPSSQNPVPGDISDSCTSLDAKSIVENGNVKDTVSYGAIAIDNCNSKDTVSNGAIASSTSSTTSYEKVHLGTAPASSKKNSSLCSPDTNVSPKITYASMVTKETPVSAPRAADVTSNVKKQTVNSVPTKMSVSLVDNAAKSPIYSNTVSKESASSSKVAPKLTTASNGATNMIANGRGIYIGRLPYDITKQGVIDVVKQFGPVKRNSDPVQIRRHQDGFCCGFVEFESADSAHRAVEAHHVKFGDKESYITYKRSYPNRGSNGEERSPTRGRSQNGNFRGQENETTGKGRFQNENWSDHIEVQARGGFRQRRPADQWSREASR